MKKTTNTTFPFGIEWVGEQLGLLDSTAKRRGSEISCRCPFPGCNDAGKRKVHTLDLNTESNVYSCMHCGAHGGMLDLYANLCGCDKKTATRELYAKWNGLPIERQIAYKASPVVVRGEDAPIKLRNAAYNMVLQTYAPTLSKEDKENLLKRGLTEEAIKANGYKTLKRGIENEVFGEDINLTKNVAGFYTLDGRRYVNTDMEGFLVPFRDIDGNIGMMQVRTGGKPKYVAFSSGRNKTERKDVAKAVSTIHFVGIDRKNPPKKVYLTEGALKADVAHCLCPQMAFIAMAGVNNRYGLKEAVELLKSLGVETVVLAFDMDFFVKEGVQKGLKGTKEILVATGIKVAYLHWHSEEQAKKCCEVDKDDKGNSLNIYGEVITKEQKSKFCKGIDDFLLFQHQKRAEAKKKASKKN